MFMCKNNLLSSLRAEAPDTEPEDPKSHQLTILFNESSWGHRWKDKIPRYDDVQSFQKHLLSLSCVSLKGFKKYSYEHVNHLIPQVHTKFWIRGLLESILYIEAETTKNTFNKSQERLLQILGCSKQDVMAEDKFSGQWVNRVTGSRLAHKLMNVNTKDSKQKLPSVRPDISVLTIAFNMILKEETQRYQDVTDPEASKDPLKLHNYRRVPDFIENWVTLSAFPTGSEMNATHWGIPVLYKIVQVFRREGSRKRLVELKEALVIVMADLFQVLKALEDTDLLTELLGDKLEFQISEQTLDDMMLKVGMFIEALVPLMAYAVLCSNTRDQKLLNKNGVIALLMSARNSKRVMFKNLKQATGKVFRCLVKSDNDDEIARGEFNDSIKENGSVPDSEVHYASAVLNNEDADALDKTIQELPTINEEEEILLRIRTENLLANKDEEFVTIVEPSNDVSSEDKVISELSKDFKTMLDFAGSSKWLQNKEKQTEDAPEVIYQKINKGNFHSPDKSSAQDPPYNQEHHLSSKRLQNCDQVVGGSQGSGFENVPSFQKGIAYDDYEMSRQDKPIFVQEEVKIMSKDEEEFRRKINSLVGEINNLPQDIEWKLTQYLQEAPFGVNKAKWIEVGTFVANNMTLFHNFKTMERKITGAFYSARTLCRIFSQYQDNVKDISPNNIDHLAKNEFMMLKSVDSKQTHMKYYVSGSNFLLKIMDTKHRRQFFRSIIHGFVETADIDTFVNDFMVNVRKAPKANVTLNAE